MRTLDDIVPPSRRQPPPPQDAPGVPPVPRRTRGRFPYATLIVAVLVIVVALFALFYFSGASVEITPNISTVTATGSYTASASGGDLAFQVISTDKSASQSVASSGTTNVTSSAQGTLTISNTQSVAQKLITNTRFATASGLIYRIHAPVTVAAASAGKPGQLNVTVYADKPGSSYNIGPSSFTLPGLSGTAQYTQVTAKSSGAISGGSSGNEPTADPALTASTRAALEASLASDLQAALATQVPEGYVLLPGAAATSYTDSPSTPSASSGMVDINEGGTITAVVFPASALAKAIALEAEGANYDGAPLTIKDPSTLTLASVTTLPASGAQSFAFTLTGSTDLLATIDPNQIASAIAGKGRDAAQIALTNFPAIKQARLVLRPFWVSTFPEDPAKIKVVVD